jgi:hypothetical protein
MTSIEADRDVMEVKNCCILTAPQKLTDRSPDGIEPSMSREGEENWTIPAITCIHSDDESDIAEDIFVTKPEEGLVISGDPPPLASTEQHVLNGFGVGERAP